MSLYLEVGSLSCPPVCSSPRVITSTLLIRCSEKAAVSLQLLKSKDAVI